MLIGELAAATGVTSKTLRFYEDAGLIDDPGRTAGGYRDYPPSAVHRIRFVRAAQSAGLTLGQIREVLDVRDAGEPPCAHVVALVEARLGELDQRLAELERARAQLLALGARARHLDPGACSPSSVCSAVDAGA